MTAPTDTGTLYQADPFHTTPPVALAPEPSALEKLDAEIAATVADLGLAKEKALAHDPDVQRYTGRLAELTEARERYTDAASLLVRLLSGESKPAPKRGRRSRHAAVDGG